MNMHVISLIIGIIMFLSSKLVLYFKIKQAEFDNWGEPVNPVKVVFGDWLNIWTFVTGIIGGILALYIFFQMQSGAV